MNKIIKTFKFLIVLFCGYMMTSCGLFKEADEHQHEYEYKHDETNHWKTCVTCNEITDKVNHTFTETSNGGSCSVKPTITHTCAECGYSYTSEGELLEHHYVETVVDPTCTSQGYTLKKCDVCGDEVKTNYTPAISHSYKLTSETPSTCTVKGSKVETCEHCGDVKTTVLELAAHTYKDETVPATCTSEGYQKKYCEVCSYVLYNNPIAKTPHTYGAIETVPATCIADGHITYKCLNCTASYTETITKLGHDYKFYSKVDATCTTDGLITNKCSRCESTTTETITKLGHNYQEKSRVEASCTVDGHITYECSNCHDTYDEGITKLGHNYQTTVVPPTCGVQGYTLHKCSRCNDEYKDTYTDALSHSYSDSVTTEPTCTVDGVRTFVCSNCSDTYTEAITKLGHNYQTTVVEPTCADQGYTLHKCSRCNDEYKDTYTDPTGDGHRIQYVEKVDPTCSQSGTIAHFECISCNKTYSDINGNNEINELGINKLNHDISKVLATTATCTEKGNIACYRCNTCNALFSDKNGNNPLSEAQVYTDALGHNYTDISYDLIKSTDEIIESNKYIFVGYTGGKYYAITKSNGAVEVSVKNGKITSLPNNVQLFEINSSDSTGYYSIFVEEGLGTNKYICSVNSGTYTTNDAGNTLNSARWKTTITSTGLATLTTDKSSNTLKNLSFYVANKKLCCCSAYNDSYTNFYIFIKNTNDVNEVRMSDGSIGAFYTCKDCNHTFEYGTNKQIAVSYKYDVINATDTIYTNDKVLLVNNYYNYSTKEDVQYEKYNIYGRISNNAIEDDEHVQVFQIKRGLIQTAFRFNYLDSDYYIYVKDTDSKFTLIRTSYLYTSQLHGSFSYTPQDGTKGQLISTTSRTCKAMMGMEAGFYMENPSNNPYGYASRYMSIYRLEYTFTDANGSYVAEIPATCETNGVMAHYVGDDGVLYNTSFVKVNSRDLIIPALGHNYSTVNKVTGADYHEIVCANDSSHKKIEKCIYNSEGICVTCSNTKDESHSHVYNMKLMTNAALVSSKTCTTYAKYKYSCSCGALGNNTFEDVAGGYAPHTSVTLDQQNPTCTSDGFYIKTYCSKCGLVEDIRTIPALGHNLDNGDFVFNSMTDKNDVTGVWTYHCNTCSATITVNGDITTRPGSTDYAYRKILEGKYQDGHDFAFLVNGEYVTLQGFDYIDSAVNVYKQIFNICEDMLDDDTDYTNQVKYSSGEDATTSLGSVTLPYITSNVAFVTADLEAAGIDYKAWCSFARGIVEWFKSDQPIYFFLNADTWYNSKTYTSTKETPRIAMTMYGTLASNTVRKYYQEELEKIYEEYNGKYLYITDERVRARVIYDKVIDMIEYTYGPSTNPDKNGTAKAPNTICPMVDGKGVCESYALSYCVLARMNGLEAEEMGSKVHAWVYCYVSGNWYIIDPTWGDYNAEVAKSTVKWFCHNVYNPDDSHTVKPQWMPFDPIGSKQLSY